MTKETARKLIGKKKLYRLYYNDKLSCAQIGRILGVGKTAIMKRMKIYNLKRRKPIERCLGNRHYNWKGGKSSEGYMNINFNRLSLKDQNLYKTMVGKSGYIFIHRLIIAKHLRRPLRKEEVVHHANGIKNDNRIENLLLLSSQKHRKYISSLTKRIRQLELQLQKQGG